MENPWEYRNKSSLPTRHDGEKVVVGMYAINSNKLVYINDCPIENEKINETRKMILNVLNKEKVDIFNPKDHSGSLRYLIIRAFPNTDDVQVCFVLTKEDKILIKLAINTAWIKYIDRLHKEEKTKDYVKDNLKIKIGFDYTDQWENGEAVYYFTMSQIYITQ